MLNSVCLMGRLANTPEVKKGRDGKEFTTATLAVPNGVDKEGNELVMFVDFVCFLDSQRALDFVDKGDQIALQGRLDLYTFTKKDGSKGYGTKIIVSSIEFGSKKMVKEESPEEAPKEEKTRRARK